MNEKRSSGPSLARRVFGSWYAKAGLALAVVLVVVYAIVPHRVTRFVSVDGAYRWGEDDPLLKQTVVWQPAEPFEDPAAGLGADDSLIRPQFAEQGNAFYFTRRTADGAADIYRSERIRGQWQPAKPVKRLNSAADDVGPVFRPDGKQLYLYSNREGGQGGFDLYVSDLGDKGWSEPRNLGPTINSAAHEYDPAVSADGLRLFFASNRSREMMRQIAEGDQQKHWTTTLRADLGSNSFDLYMARRPDPDDPWQPAQPLVEVNHPQADEGAPCVGPHDAFLYFVSNRVARPDETPNFDIYRARIRDDRVFAMENLGAGVNTPVYNEIEPALSEEGFQLFFSSDRPLGAAPGEIQPPTLQYTLYRSKATEIFKERDWGPSRLAALWSFLLRNWWWLLTALLALAFLLALAWYLRQVSLRRLSVPGFFLIALLIHILGGFSSFFVYFREDIMAEIRQFKELVVATNMSADGLHQSHEAGQEAYEKVADLKSLDALQLSDVARQQTEIPSVPVRTDTPVPQVPLALRRELPPDRLVAAVPEIKPEVVDPEVERRRLAMLLDAERVEIQATEAVEQVRREVVERVPVELRQRPTEIKLANLPTLRRRTMDAVQIEPEHVAAERVVEQPVKTPAAEQPAIERASRTAPELETAPKVETEAIEAVAAAAVRRELPGVEVAVAPRQPAGRTAAPPTLRRRALPETVQLAPESVAAERTAERPLETAIVREPAIERAVREVAESISPPQVRTEAIQAVVAAPGSEQSPERVDVAVARRAPAAAPTDFPTLRRRTAPTVSAKVAPEDVVVQRVAEKTLETKMDQEPTTLERSSHAAAEPDAVVQVRTESLAAPLAGPPAESQPGSLRIAVARRQQAAVAAGSPPAPPRAAVRSDVPIEREEVRAELVVARPRGIGANEPPAEMRRAASPAAELMEPASVGTETIDGPVAGAKAERLPGGVSVAVGPRPAADQPASVPALGRRAAVDAVTPPSPERVEVEPVAETPPGMAAGTAKPDEMPAQRSRAPAAVDADEAPIEAVAAVAPPASRPASASKLPAGVDVAVERPETEMASAPVKTPGAFGGSYDAQRPTLALGSLEKERIDAPLSFSPQASRITRRPAKAPMLLYAEDAIGLRAMFRLRQGDAKEDIVTAFGGSDETLKAVHRGLDWLGKHQHEDGHWSFEKFYNEEKGHAISGKGNVANDAGATGFGLLPFLGDGNTHADGAYQSNVRKGVEWLIEQQNEEGDLCPKAGSNTHMYSHAIAAIALCEAYGMSKDPKLRDPAQRSIDFIVDVQDRDHGGWRYNPRGRDTDTSVVGWQMMAIKSGQMAGLDVPQSPFPLVDKWLRSVEGRGKEIGRFGYQGRDYTPAMTAEGLLCLQYLGVDQNDPRLVAGANYLLENLPTEKSVNSYYWYYATQVMFHLQGDYWRKWNEAQRDMLVRTQEKEGREAGTWDPKDQWEHRGGRLYATSLRLLMLEVYYRHLPLYQMRAEQ